MNTFTPHTEGVFFDLPEDVYRAAPGISQSELKQFGEEATPAHFLDARKKERNVTEDMEFGTILHTAILQPHLLDKAYYVEPDQYPVINKKTGAIEEMKPWTYKADHCKEWLKKHSDRPVISKEKEATIAKIVDSVHQLEFLPVMLKNGRKEVSFFKRDEETGLLLKCRLDCVSNSTEGTTYILDLKKVQRGEARQDRFAATIADRGYDIQAASYLSITGASHFYFVAIEDGSPFESMTHVMSATFVDLGMKKWRQLLRDYARCVEKGWPGYTKEPEFIYPPEWAVRKAS